MLQHCEYILQRVYDAQTASSHSLDSKNTLFGHKTVPKVTLALFPGVLMLNSRLRRPTILCSKIGGEGCKNHLELQVEIARSPRSGGVRRSC